MHAEAELLNRSEVMSNIQIPK